MMEFLKFCIFFVTFASFLQAQEIIEIPTATNMYQLSYFLDRENSNITFQVTAETKGFIGFGFTNISGMVQSDIFIGGMYENGTSYFGDYSSASTSTPRRDTEQNWELLEASETELTTYLQFRRSLETTDSNDINITDSLMNIIWALGPSTDALTYHGFGRSNLKFNLFEGTNGGETPEPPPITTTISTTTTTTTTTPSPSVPIEIPFNTSLLHGTYTISEDIITFVLTSTTTGYIGFGFSNTSGMLDADMFIGGVHDDNLQFYFGDYNSRSFIEPVPDVENDWTIISGSQTEDETTLSFSRHLITPDYLNDVPIEDKELRVIWALGTSDVLQHHRSRGQVLFNFFSEEEIPSSTVPPSSTSSDEPDSSSTPTSIRTNPPTTTTTTTTTTERPPGNGEIPLGTDLLKITYSISGENVTFIAKSQSKGYIGFGFTNASGMVQADIFIGGVSDNGDTYFGDYNSFDYVTPTPDPEQNWVLISGTEIGNETTLQFSRLLDTRDAINDVIIENKTMTLIWALGSTDDLARHANRGQASFNLIGDEDPTPPPTTQTTEDPGTTAAPTPGEIPMGTNLIRVTFTVVDSSITFTAVARTTGYVAFGFTNSTGMEEADIFIAGVNGGIAYSEDCNSRGHTRPPVDSTPNWNLVSATESSGETTIVFSRLLDTGDGMDDIIIEDKDMTIMWAIGATDTIEPHGPNNRGLTIYNLIQAPPTLPPMDPLSKTIPIGTDSLNITYEIVGESITFQAIGQTRGFIGFGFSNGTGGMNSSDIFIAWVLDDGTVGFVDTFAHTTDPPGAPQNDTQQNWVLLSGEEVGSQTRLVFSRPLVTDDDEEDIPIEDKYMRIVWAMGYEDFITYHGETNRGQVSFNLISGNDDGNSSVGGVRAVLLLNLGMILITVISFMKWF